MLEAQSPALGESTASLWFPATFDLMSDQSWDLSGLSCSFLKGVCLGGWWGAGLAPWRRGCEDTDVVKKTLRFRVFSGLGRSHSGLGGRWVQADMMGLLGTSLDPKLADFSLENFLQKIFIVRFHSKGSWKQDKP